jgi:hypothetical protein
MNRQLLEGPIHAVAGAMGWTYQHAQIIVEEMMARKLVEPTSGATDATKPMKIESWWEKGPA